ncbi:hypothetical protein FQA39_LY12042 [Lamprigera yunnana]|nr:hypothetical protein FQA39_LY12042 [Lamprigera yunnana]
MSNRGEELRTRGSNSRPPFLHERVGQVYYAHGLFCTSYPATVISFTIFIALLCCYPLLNLPLPGNLPLQLWSSESNTSNLELLSGKPPWCYIQQVIIKTAVLPWDTNLYLSDAFRAPLYEAFKLLEVVRNYQESTSLKTLGHVCVHVEAVKKINDVKNDILPQYSCLVLSPASFWRQDVQQFTQDSSILNTVFDHQNIQKGKTSVAEMLFGMHLSDTGMKRYPLRNRQRILQYAITLFLKENDQLFISGLRHKLQTLYPLHQNITHLDASVIYNDTAYIYYPGEFNYNEFFPVAVAYFLLFLYYYFSVRKIELINSKIAMAFTVLLTVLTSLGMTLGICFFFGLTFSLQGKEIFPYLVILVGLENVLVITKSVVSTPQHLDAKIRVAQGLCKEGWSITKNLLIEITILTIGLFTFVPAIQEFCIFAIVGLLTDFFLQMLFFYTVLSIDARHVENLVEKNNPRNNLYQTHFYDKNTNLNAMPRIGMHRSKSHPRLSTDVVAGQIQGAQEKKIPKRLRLVNIWARTRFFQRAFMLLMVIWIARILYNSGIVEQYFIELTEKNNHKTDNTIEDYKQNISDIVLNLNSLNLHKSFEANSAYINFVTQRPIEYADKHNQTDELNKLKHRDYPPWLRLSTQHWAAILKKYNISLSGRSIAILPNIKISYSINPQQAVLLRNSEEKNGQKFHWQTLAAALDPIDFNDLDGSPELSNFFYSNRPLYPSSPMEIFLTTILCIISVVVLAYAFVVLYRCICSRNYAEWRASWFCDKTEENEVQVLLEAVPVVLNGHPQEIECISTDGLSVASTCLGGQIKVWDTITGELIKTIDRRSYFTYSNKSPELSMELEDNLSDYESGSPPSRDEALSFPSFQHKINTNFTNLKLSSAPNYYNTKFNFGMEYRQLYAEHKKELKFKHRNNDTVKWVQTQRHNSDLMKIEFNNKRNGHSEVLNNFILSDLQSPIKNDSESVVTKKISPIWCMDYLENLIVIGCADGSLEFWEGTTGNFRCSYDDKSGVGVTSVKIIGSHVIAARLYGTLDFLRLQSYSQGRPIDWNFTCAYRRTHMRTSSTGSLTDYEDIIRQHEDAEDIRCTKIVVVKAHQQPITCFDSEGGRVLTGSQDHCLKVFRLQNGTPLYTLHGHCGPITCLFIDRVCPAMSGSGSQDGMLCVWDLLTGACMYSIQAHDGSIMSLTYSASYVISLGSDERLCVWERFQGHLLNTIQIMHSFPSNVLMLTPHLIVTARSGGLVIWDARSGECVKTFSLGHSPYIFVKQMLLVRDVVLCDFGNQLHMGVPKFFRFISERYPCLSEVVKEYQIPEFDNLYLDMNGIIHVCSHPDDLDPHFRITEHKIFTDIFHYIDVLFRLIRPRKLFFMAVDGVAPRAKMNQQRGRRFRTAKDAQAAEAKAKERGEQLPDEAKFDSNCITPGTVFMARLQKQLQYFVVNKISTDKLWRNCTVVLSGPETPGEGEHKIMDYIRYMRAQPGYNPNTRHCLYGLDADLIMLGLCTHEPHFSLLREEVRFGKKDKRRIMPEQIPFYLLHLSLMREYLDLEFQSLKSSLTFEYNVENIIDDWVLMGFLVGNDFIPHLPNMHIDGGALPVLYKAYIKVLPKLDGYINEGGILNLKRFEVFIQELSGIDIHNFTEIYADLKWFEAKTGHQFPEKNPQVSSKSDEDNLLIDIESTNNSELQMLIEATNDILLDTSMCAEDSDTENYSEISDNEDYLFHAEFLQHKTDYYMNKLEYADVTDEVLISQTEEYIRAIQWNLHYYYNGVCSWSWFYPHHYAPYISDIKNFSHLKLNFNIGDPFKPYEQLLAVLPAASRVLLPEPYHDLMTNETSPIKDYYPEDFKTDLNGKKHEWEAVVLIPFIDEEVLLSAMKSCNEKLTIEEKERNKHGPMLIFQYTDENMNEYSAPQYFLPVKESHAKYNTLLYTDILIPIDKLIKGAYPGAKCDVYYTGFPTMRHLNYSGVLEKAKVKVFQQPSRHENMILVIEKDNNLEATDAIAKDLLGKTVYVGWPHLIEARVLAVSCPKYKYNSTGQMGQYNVQDIQPSLWDSDRRGITEFYKNRFGVEVGITETLVYVNVMVGRKYIFSNMGRVTLEKQFSEICSIYPLQTIVKGINIHEESYKDYKNIESVYPIGSYCFMLGQPGYGGLGEVLDSKESLKCGRIKISIKKYEEPDLSTVIDLNHNISVRFMNTHVASARLAISKKLFGRITGSIYIQPRGANQMDSVDYNVVNIGLNLKFNKKNEEVPGYTHKEGNTWYYSEKAISLVADYMNEFPVIFEFLNFNIGRDNICDDDIFPNGDAKEHTKRITAWIKKQPFYAIERQVCGSSGVDPEAIQMLEKIVELTNRTSKIKQIVMQVKPHLLYKCSLQMGNVMPDSRVAFELFDRVVNVREDIMVPLAYKGTIIAIHKSSNNDDSETVFDVLFDEPFMGACSINGSTNRCYKMSKPSLINISHGIRVFEQKSGKVGQLQNIQNQGPSRYVLPPQSSDLNYPQSQFRRPQGPMFTNWAKGCNFPPLAPSVSPFSNNKYNYQVTNVNRPFPNPPLINQYGNSSNFSPFAMGSHSFVPYKNNPIHLNAPSIPPQHYTPISSHHNAQEDLMSFNHPQIKEKKPKEILQTPNNKVPDHKILNQQPTKVSASMSTSLKTGSDKNTVLTPEDIFIHAKAKAQSPLIKNHVDPSNKDYSTALLLKEFQSLNLGIPNYEYFKIKDSFVARVKVPDGPDVIGKPSSSKNQSAENVAFEVLEVLKKNRQKKPSLPPFEPPLHSVPPKPPQQWQNVQSYNNPTSPQIRSNHHELDIQEDLRSDGKDNEMNTSSKSSQSQNKVNVGLVNKSFNSETSKVDNYQKRQQHTNVGTASFVPLQAVRQHRSRTTSNTSEVTSKENDESVTEMSSEIKQDLPEEAKSIETAVVDTKFKPKRERKMRIAANFQVAVVPK